MTIALAVSELYLRMNESDVAHDLRGLHVVRPDRAWLYGLRPGARGTLGPSGNVLYEINGDGFRGPQVARPKPPNTFRVLAFGDSVTFGYGVAGDEVYAARMQAMLGPGVEVVNLGVGGYNPYNEAALLEDVGPSYEPDLVLVQFCTNDLTDPTLHFDAHTRTSLGPLPEAAYPDPKLRRGPPPARRAAWLRVCSGLRVCQRIDEVWTRWNAGARDTAAEMAALRSPDRIPSVATRRWLAGHYERMASVSRALGADFAVLAFPFRAQVDGAASDRLQTELVALGAEGGWDTLDLLPAFAAAAGGAPLFLDSWHPTALGHRVAAGAIVEHLAQQGLVGGRPRE